MRKRKHALSVRDMRKLCAERKFTVRGDADTLMKRLQMYGDVVHHGATAAAETSGGTTAAETSRGTRAASAATSGGTSAKQERFEEPRVQRKLIVKTEKEEMESQEQAEAAVKQEALLSVPPVVKQDAAMPVLPVVKKEARFEELEEKRKKEALMHGQLASLSTAADDWNDTEVGEESEMDSQYDFPECRTSPTAPRWLDEQTEIPSEEYNSYDYQLTDTLEYRVFLPHRVPNCGMTTTFSDLCDFLCEPLKHARNVREKRCLRSEPLKCAHDVREKLRGWCAVQSCQSA